MDDFRSACAEVCYAGPNRIAAEQFLLDLPASSQTIPNMMKLLESDTDNTCLFFASKVRRRYFYLLDLGIAIIRNY